MSGFPDLRTSLPDGAPLLIRAARPDDAELVRLGFAQLSDRSRHFRFLRAMPRLSDADLAFLAHPESESQEAIGALDLNSEPPTPVGLARYVLLPGSGHRAELSVTVVDSHQGRGLGTLLIGCLAWHAERRGVDCFVALVASRNTAMLDLLGELGGVVDADFDDELQLIVPLHADPEAFPDTPAGRAVRTAHHLADAAIR